MLTVLKRSETGVLDCPEDPELVKKARELEMQHMEDLKVLEDCDLDACMAETGRPPIPTGWVDINKGDSLKPSHRLQELSS